MQNRIRLSRPRSNCLCSHQSTYRTISHRLETRPLEEAALQTPVNSRCSILVELIVPYFSLRLKTALAQLALHISGTRSRKDRNMHEEDSGSTRLIPLLLRPGTFPPYTDAVGFAPEARVDGRLAIRNALQASNHLDHFQIIEMQNNASDIRCHLCCNLV